MVVMSGLTTAVWFLAILASRGSSHPLKHSPATDAVSIQDPPRGRRAGKATPTQRQTVQGWAPTVSVKEGERVTGGNRGPQEPGGDEPLPLALADDPDNAEALQVPVQFVLQRL